MDFQQRDINIHIQMVVNAPKIVYFCLKDLIIDPSMLTQLESAYGNSF